MRVTVHIPPEGDRQNFVVEMEHIPAPGDVFMSWETETANKFPRYYKVLLRQWIIDHAQTVDSHKLPVNGTVHDVWLFAELTNDSVQELMVTKYNAKGAAATP